MAFLDNNQDLGEGIRRFLISESYPEYEYSQFREYCVSSNIIFVDELHPYDYAAFRAQLKADADFVRKIRARAESIISGEKIITRISDVPEAIVDGLETEPPTEVNKLSDALWDISLKAAANEYLNTPLDGFSIPNRVRHRLVNAGITTIGRMLLTTPEQFFSIGFMGDHSLSVIKSISDDLVREYINRNLSHQNAPLISAIEQEADQKHDFSDQMTASTEEQKLDAQQPVNEYDDDTWNSVLVVAANEFLDVPLHVMNLPIRVYNRLLHAGFDTVSRVLLATDEQLLDIKHLGEYSLHEIRAASKKIVLNFIDNSPDWQHSFSSLDPEVQKHSNHSITKKHSNISGNLRNHIEKIILSGNALADYCSEFTVEEEKIINRINQAIEVIGIGLCKYAYDELAITKQVIQGFQTFIEFQQAVQTIKNLYSAIPDSRRAKKLSPYITLFNQLQLLTEDDLLKVFSTCTIISDITDKAYFIAEQENQHRVKKFLEWLSFDIMDFVRPILAEAVGEGNRKQIVTLRAAGETLEAISAIYGLTRERIRQIEAKAFRKFSSKNLTQPLLLAVSAEFDGETIITSDDIRRLIPDSEILLYLLKKCSDSKFKYDENIDSFYQSAITDPISVYDFVSRLPKYIYESELEPLLSQICQSNNIPRKFLELAFKKHYRQSGTIWHVGKMSRSSMYSFVIEKYFPTGFKLYDPVDMARFRNYVREVFGDTGGSESDRALWGIIQKISVLYDRGEYIHPSRVAIPEDLLQRIEEFFINSGRTSISFHELHKAFEEELLLRANIANRYALQGVLKIQLGDKYIFYRDGISTKEGYKITEEIERYIRKTSPVSKETIMAAFSGISEAMLMQNIARLPSVILTENSTYIHSKGLKLSVDDYNIIKIIETYTDNHPVTASKLLEILYTTHSDFLFRNNISSPNTLFGILQFMFSDMFSFSRPYISSLNTKNISKREIILLLLEGQEHVNIADLISLCEEHHLSFQSPTLMIRALQDNYLRVDEETLVLITNFNVTNEKLNEIKELLSNAILLKGYLVFRSIDNFIFYPDLGFTWTPFLLRSIIDKYFSDDFKFIDNPTNQDIAFDLIVDPQLQIDNYEELVRSVIRTEHQRDPFKDETSVVKWLIDEGLLAKKAVIIKEEPGLFSSTDIRLVYRYIPKFLTDGSFLYIDEYGKLIIN